MYLIISLVILLTPPAPQHLATAVSDTATLDAEILQQHTTYFKLTPAGFEGADALKADISNAGFIALGELHNSRNMARFTETLLRFSHPLGFDRLAVETGPYSAEKLESLIAQNPETVRDFYDEYSSKLFNIYPIPFFTGEADLYFLATADSLGYDLWGLDQEFYYSFGYLIDELARQTEQLSGEQEDLQSDLRSKLWWWHRRSKIFSGFDMACRLKQRKKLSQYLNSFEGADEPVENIITSIQRSLKIYCLAESGQWSTSNQNRIAYFKENFDRNYIPLKEVRPDSLPKVIIKMGSYHAGRDKSPLGIHDMGHHLHETAREEGRQSLHLRFLVRWMDGDDKMGAENYRLSTNFMKVADPEEWALIDTRPLRKQLREGKLKASKFETREILNYDYIIVMPEDRRVDKHY